MTNNKTAEEITSEKTLDNVIADYNRKASDMHKFAFNKDEKELICNMIDWFADVKTSESQQQMEILGDTLADVVKNRDSLKEQLADKEKEVNNLKDEIDRWKKWNVSRINATEPSPVKDSSESKDLLLKEAVEALNKWQVLNLAPSNKENIIAHRRSVTELLSKLKQNCNG